MYLGTVEVRYTGMYVSSSFQGPNQLTRSHFLKANGQTVLTMQDGNHPNELNTLFYTFSDHLGSACTLMEAGGHIISREYHTPFGETAYSSTSRARYRYCGKEKDSESGLYYYGARYYSAWTCRFVSVDPLAEKRMWLTSYNYAQNSPICRNDPTGLLDKEYPSKSAYQAENPNGKLDGSDGHWLTSDREGNTSVWQNANYTNLQANRFNDYTTITQRADFYGWVQTYTSSRGGETKWAGAAKIIAQQMSLMENSLIKLFTDDKVIAFAHEGNKAIFNDVFSKLKDLVNMPPKKGEEAIKWDKETLTHEQMEVVQPIYSKQDPDVIKQLQNLAEGKGMDALLGKIFYHVFPIGGQLAFEGNINDWSDRYNHGLNKAVPFYEKYGTIFNWNLYGDGRIDTFADPDHPGWIKPWEPKY